MHAQLGSEQAKSAAQAAMAAASATLQQKRVEVLIPPQAADWLKVTVSSPSIGFFRLLSCLFSGVQRVDASLKRCMAIVHCFCLSMLFPQAVSQPQLLALMRSLAQDLDAWQSVRSCSDACVHVMFVCYI